MLTMWKSSRLFRPTEGIECSSELTMGSVICGNPSKALRQRRQGGPGSKDEIKKGLGRLMQKVSPEMTKLWWKYVIFA